jgi:hypothetical protein
MAHQPPFGASTALLLTDGTVMCQDDGVSGGNAWWKLTPDSSGQYSTGTWSQVSSLPSNYGPLYYASAVLPDGRLVIMGGEYNFGNIVWTNQGAIYDPAKNVWTKLTAPASWTMIGDAESVVLPNGKFMVADPFSTATAVLNATTLTFSLTNAKGKADGNDEEGWNLLPDGSVLTVDAVAAPNSERYIQSMNEWITAGSTIVRLEDPVSEEIGPAVLRPDGTVFATGACDSGGTNVSVGIPAHLAPGHLTPSGACSTPGHTAIYTPPTTLTGTGTWTPGPNFPDGLDIADGPAALLTSGNVLMATSPGVYLNGIKFFEWNGTALVSVPDVPNAPSEPSYVGRMLILPTGEILWTDGSSDAELYTSSGSPSSSWEPTITSVSSKLVAGQTYTISGTQFNGLSQGAAYGDDAQSATNYPLVRLTNQSTKHVFYCKTHNHSTMGVATGSTPVRTEFDVPSNVETGASSIQVVANGIASAAKTVQVSAP